MLRGGLFNQLEELELELEGARGAEAAAADAAEEGMKSLATVLAWALVACAVGKKSRVRRDILHFSMSVIFMAW